MFLAARCIQSRALFGASRPKKGTQGRRRCQTGSPCAEFGEDRPRRVSRWRSRASPSPKVRDLRIPGAPPKSDKLRSSRNSVELRHGSLARLGAIRRSSAPLGAKLCSLPLPAERRSFYIPGLAAAHGDASAHGVAAAAGDRRREKVGLCTDSSASVVACVCVGGDGSRCPWRSSSEALFGSRATPAHPTSLPSCTIARRPATLGGVVAQSQPRNDPLECVRFPARRAQSFPHAVAAFTKRVHIVCSSPSPSGRSLVYPRVAGPSL